MLTIELQTPPLTPCAVSAQVHNSPSCGLLDPLTTDKVYARDLYGWDSGHPHMNRCNRGK